LPSRLQPTGPRLDGGWDLRPPRGPCSTGASLSASRTVPSSRSSPASCCAGGPSASSPAGGQCGPP